MTSMNDLTVEELKQLIELLYDEKMRANMCARKIGAALRKRRGELFLLEHELGKNETVVLAYLRKQRGKE